MNKFCCLTVLAIGLLCGCTSVYTGTLLEPVTLPDENYGTPAFARETKKFPVGLDLRDCPQECPITCIGVFGGSDVRQKVNLREIVQREFAKMTQQNFSKQSGTVAPILQFRVEARRINLKRDHYFWWFNPDRMTAEVQLKVTLFDPEDIDRVPIYEQIQTLCEVSDREETGNRYVPDCFYRLAVKLAHTVIRDISNDPAAMARIKTVFRKHDKFVETERGATIKSFGDFQLVPGSRDVSRGVCVVACNDWDAAKTDTWATQQILSKCATHLNVPEANVRVTYQVHNLTEKECRYEFLLCPRRDYVFQYSTAARKGQVFVDPELAHLASDQASQIVRARILAEMKARNGVFSSLQGENTPLIRLGDVKTDPATGLMTFDFTLE